MAKFLPFVVDKSTPIHIYQTLVSRSKGMNSVLVASILYLVLEKGISVVRETAAELPDMDLDKLYGALINAYPSYRITNEQHKKVQLVCKHVIYNGTGKISKELDEYDPKDIMSFLLVMLLVGKLEEYTSFRLDKLFNDEAESSEVNIKNYKLFSNDGKDYIFASEDALEAYVWFYTTIMHTDMEPVHAVYDPGSKVNSYGNDTRKVPDNHPEFVSGATEAPSSESHGAQGRSKMPEASEPESKWSSYEAQ